MCRGTVMHLFSRGCDDINIHICTCRFPCCGSEYQTSAFVQDH